MVCNLAIDAYYGCMADFSHILMTRPDFGDDDREWLHQLVADWQVIADLSFADLLLILQNGEGKYIIAEQCLSLIHISCSRLRRSSAPPLSTPATALSRPARSTSLSERSQRIMNALT